MNKKIIMGVIIGIIAVAVVVCAVVLIPSGQPDKDDPNQGSNIPSGGKYPSEGGETPSGGDDLSKEFNGISFNSATFVYDGKEKALKLEGELPAGASVAYTNEKGVNAGIYNATAVLSCKGYKTLTLSATLTIEKATMVGISLTGNIICEYDALEHSLAALGDIPDGSTVTITYNDEKVSGVTEVGTYIVRLLVTNPNYYDYEVSETLRIIAIEEMLYSVVSGDSVYFQNALDSNKLYVYKNNTISKVNNDIPNYLTEKDGILYYNSTSLFSSVIKSCDASNRCSILVEFSGKWLVSDGTYMYYAINNLLFNREMNGIYRFHLNGENSEPVRIVKDQAKYLALCNGNIYYSNADDGGKLYCVSSDACELETGTLVYEEKSEYIISDGYGVYFNSTSTVIGIGVASAIRKYNPETGACIKLTTDSGKYLTKIGNYIYYVNDDLLTGTIFGDGIYKVSALLTNDNNLPGVKILSCEDNGYYSLASDGEKLYYYKLNDKHLYSYDIASGKEVDLMANFTPIVEEIIPSGFASLTEYNGEIYYTDPRDNGCLYKYNKNANAKYKVLANSVSNVYFYDGYMYYSTYIITNFALWRMDLTTKESVKISTSRCDNLIFEGDSIYYIKVGSVYNNKIMKMGLDGSNPEILYENENLWVKTLEKKGDMFYFTINPAFGYKYIYSYDIITKTENNLKLNSTVFTIDGDSLYYYDKGDNTICCYDLVSKKKTTLVKNMDINDLKVFNGKLYYSSMKSTNKGFFFYDLKTKAIKRISENCAHGMIYVNGYIYYIRASVDYVADYATMYNGDGYLCCYDGKTEKKL